MASSEPPSFTSPLAGASSSTPPTNPSSAPAAPAATEATGPLVVPANASQGGREVNKRVLYVGGVDQNVTEDMLSELFKVTGNVGSIKIFPDKNRRGFNYAFVEYDDNRGAQLAFETLDGRVLNQSVS